MYILLHRFEMRVKHQSYIRETLTQAAEAAERGDRPCGSLLVRDEEILKRASNRVYSGDDITLHPELTLIRWLAAECSVDQQRETILYTTIEPCSMCATAIAQTDLGAVVYAVPGDSYWKLAAKSSHAVPDDYIPCAEVFDRLGSQTSVDGSVLTAEGLAVVREWLNQ